MRRLAEGGAPDLMGALESLGASCVVLCHEPAHPLLFHLAAALRATRAVAVAAVDARVGAALAGREGLTRAALLSLDREEARAALSMVEQAMILAEQLAASALIVHLGEIEELAQRWPELRRRFLRGELHEDREPAERFLMQREALAPRHLSACLRGLERIARLAERRGMSVLLPNPRRASALPAALELRVLLEELRGASLAPLLDVPAAHLSHVMRLFPLSETVASFSAGPLSFLGDACGPVGGLIPGQGEVDLPALSRHMGARADRAFIPWSGLRMDEVRRGYEAMTRLPLG